MTQMWTHTHTHHNALIVSIPLLTHTHFHTTPDCEQLELKQAFFVSPRYKYLDFSLFLSPAVFIFRGMYLLSVMYKLQQGQHASVNNIYFSETQKSLNKISQTAHIILWEEHAVLLNDNT